MERREAPRSDADRRHNHAERERRETWRRNRRVGDPTATFRAGDHLRCPGTTTIGGGHRAVCGAHLGTVKAGALGIVRVRRTDLPRLPYGGEDRICHKCDTPLEIFTPQDTPAVAEAAPATS